MYHDQGIGPLKTLDFERVVNVTLGLSFVRTSPGHGTAYDIAWQGKAGVRSLWEAFKLALHLSRNRERSHG
jgi:4-hydroxythreonine-4-phosphate dehydrogenase